MVVCRVSFLFSRELVSDDENAKVVFRLGLGSVRLAPNLKREVIASSSNRRPANKSREDNVVLHARTGCVP
jgi:hypothetical protein